MGRKGLKKKKKNLGVSLKAFLAVSNRSLGEGGPVLGPFCWIVQKKLIHIFPFSLLVFFFFFHTAIFMWVSFSKQKETRRRVLLPVVFLYKV